MPSITQRVENILKASKLARNSDKELLVIYMQKSGMDLDQRQIAIFRDMPSSETIRRIRQKLQENGKYSADPEVEEARYKKYKEMRGSIGIATPRETERVLEDGTIVLPNGDRVLP